MQKRIAANQRILELTNALVASGKVPLERIFDGATPVPDEVLRGLQTGRVSLVSPEQVKQRQGEWLAERERQLSNLAASFYVQVPVKATA